MRKAIFLAAILAAVVSTSPALAADWTGFYVGGNVGYGFGRTSSNADLGPFLDPFQSSQRTAGFLGGVQVGYNYEFNNRFVLGAEADYDFASIKGSGSTNFLLGGFIPTTVQESAKLTSFGTMRGRAGYDLNGWLLYATGGWAFGHANLSDNASVHGWTIANYSGSHSVNGWVAGAGVEKFVLNNNVSVKVEYLHLDFGSFATTDSSIGGPVTVGRKMTDDIVRVGVNYRFN